MEALIALVLLYLFFALILFPIWAYLRIDKQKHRLDHLEANLESTREQLGKLRATLAEKATTSTTNASALPSAVTAPANPPASTPATGTIPAPTVPVSPPPLLPPVRPLPPLVAAATPSSVNPPSPTPARIPPPLAPAYTPPPPKPNWTDNLNWEQFMGAKLFAWLGAIALFLGVGYFVKYSFENNLIPPEVRVALGFVVAIGLVIGGLRVNRERYRVTAEALIAAGIVSLYAVTFVCGHHVYSLLPTGALMVLMVLITTTAFLLAVRLHAQFVAILGLLGGFLTPILLSTGVDNPGGLFGYIALLDLGLLAVALRTGWMHLVPFAAGGTVMMLLGWTDRFFTGAKGDIAMGVCLGFGALFVAATEFARRRGHSHPALSWSAAALPFVGLGYALFFLGYPSIAENAPLYLGFVLLLDLLLMGLAWKDDSLPQLHLAAGGTVFLLMSIWTSTKLTDDQLPVVLGFYLAFAALHTAGAHLLQRLRPASSPTFWSQIFPPLTLILMLLPFVRLETTSWLLWPAILLVDIIALVLALFSASLVGVGVVLVLTLVATGLSLLNVPAHAALDSSLLLVLGGFSVFFFAAGFWLVRKLGHRIDRAATDGFAGVFGDQRAQLPAFASLLPFLLLMMVCGRLSVPDPTMVFGLALLLVVLTLGVARILLVEWLPLCALFGVTALAYIWHGRHFQPANATLALTWHVIFYAAFTVFPFVFRRQFSGQTGPWAVAALVGIGHYPLVHRLVQQTWPNDLMGLIPVAFAIAPLLSLAFVLRLIPAAEPKRLNQLAWFGGTGLLFITLIFPVQFDRQWITVAWALEGAALLWLFQRVPHSGLRATGVVLLGIAFVRLSLNSAVLSYHVRADTAILNWYLYAYGTVIATLFAGARLLAPPRERTLGLNAPAWLNTFGVILTFLLLNIQIADYFTEPGAYSLTFRFSGNLARDMTYTIAWALFALGLLGTGIRLRLKSSRVAAIVLLGVAIVKLFFHDLVHLSALYRVAALIVVAVIALVASFAYQRFQPSHEKTPPSAP